MWLPACGCLLTTSLFIMMMALHAVNSQAGEAYSCSTLVSVRGASPQETAAEFSNYLQAFLPLL